MMKAKWIEQFENEHNRPPRILHIGNIANNAYQISKMLNEQGVQSDVLCYDYYHCMGCPEWDDADFSGDFGDPFFPRWDRVDLHGFERPRWFAQGPLDICVKYLIAYREGKSAKSNRLWRALKRSQKQPQKSVFFKIIVNAARLARYSCVLLSTNPSLFWIKLKTKLSSKTKNERMSKWRSRPEWFDLLKRLREDAAKYYPDRHMEFGEECFMYFSNIPLFQKLFGYYDIVQAYATCPIIPYLAGFKNYVAFEHGSIRELPYVDDPQGRLMLLAYANAKSIYLTNIDCYQDASYMTRYANAQIVCGLHGLDVKKIIRSVSQAALKSMFDGRFGVSSDIPLFFSPSRHDRIPDNKFYKGDEKVIGAAIRLIELGYDFRLVFTEFGSSVQDIKDIIHKNSELEKRIIWTEILDKEKLYKAFSCADAILDQFFLRAFGSVTFEALAAGHALLISSSTDRVLLNYFFSEQPPYYSCYEENEIFDAMTFVINKRKAASEIAKKGPEWLMQYHSKEQILDACCRAYSNII